MIIYKVWLTTAAIKILIDYSYTIYRRFTMNKDTLLNALNNYLLHIQLDPIGDITSKINAVEACRNYVAAIDGDVVNADWVKSNCIIILPAITCYRKMLKENIDEAKLSGDENSLSELRTESRDLQSYLDLLKPFKKFFA